MVHCRAHIMSICFLLLACNDQQVDGNAPGNNSADTPNQTPVETTVATQACYTSIESQNRVELQLGFKNDSVTGTMNYQITGKDKNMGKLRGTVRGDSIFAEYSFSSEGKESVREVAFLQKQDSLLEGYGDVEEKAGKMIFKNTSALNFGKGVVLKKVDCRL